MRRTHELPLVAGATVGLAIGLGGVALGMLLARKEDRAMRQLAQQATRSFVLSKVRTSNPERLHHDRGLHVGHLAQQVRLAGEQYLPKAREALSGALACTGLNGRLLGSTG
jgi:hypothetical protein